MGRKKLKKETTVSGVERRQVVRKGSSLLLVGLHLKQEGKSEKKRNGG